MTPAQLDSLKELIAAEPYASMESAECAQAVNVATVNSQQSRFVTERTVLAEWDDPVGAETFLQTLEAIASQNPVVARAMRWMRPTEGGIDIGHPGTRAMMLSLVTAGVLPQAGVDKLLAMAPQIETDLTASLGLPKLYAHDIEEARR